MRKLILGVLSAVFGAIVAVIGVIVAGWWVTDEDAYVVETATVPTRAQTIAAGSSSYWALLLGSVAAGGTVLALLLGLMGYVVGRSRHVRGADSPVHKPALLMPSAAVVGAVIAVISASTLRIWHRLEDGGFGWYGEPAPPLYADYLVAPVEPSKNWTSLLAPAAVGGAVAGLLLGVAGYLVYRRRVPARAEN